MNDFVASPMAHLLVCSVGVGLLVGFLSLAWKRLFDVDLVTREVSLLTGGVIGLLAGFRFTMDYYVAAQISGILVGGAFGLKLLTHLLREHW